MERLAAILTVFAVYMALLGDGSAVRAEAPVQSPLPSCGCHAKDGKKYVHSPVKKGDCLLCHRQTDKMHPKIKKAFDLKDKGNAGLCYECHDRKNTKKVQHPPVESGKCGLCHDPHQSDFTSLQRLSGSDLCFSCHVKKDFERKFPHLPIKKGECTKCHDVHDSANVHLLKESGAKLCAKCHDRKYFHGKSMHEPVAKGDCTACHVSHGTKFENLLKHEMPKDFYLPYTEETYPLCFSCHKRQLVAESNTESTGFRNGTFNLHYLHVNQEKGRSCRACHEPHTSNQQKLISSRVPGFGKWKIPIRFTRTAVGGTCVVGCHAPKTYNREVPVEY